MAKEKMTITVDPGLLSDVDADAKRAGLNRSEYVARALRDQHYRQMLDQAGAPAPMDAGEEGRLRDLLTWQSNPTRHISP